MLICSDVRTFQKKCRFLNHLNKRRILTAMFFLFANLSTVNATGFRLTANPSYAKLMFRNEIDETGYANTKFTLWINTGNRQNNQTSYTFYFGDGATSVSTLLECSQLLVNDMSGPWRACLNFPHTFNGVGEFEGKIVIDDKTGSSKSFKALFTVFIPVTNLRLHARYSENVTHPYWVPGFPRILSELEQTSYSHSFFPVGKPILITATAKFGSELSYCFFSSVEGNISSCSESETTSPNSVIRTFDYDTPCLSRLENCGVTLWVVASNSMDIATTSITIYLQKRSANMVLIENGPRQENASFPLSLEFSQFPTDGCVEVDYGTDYMFPGLSRTQLFGSEYMCAERYNQHTMKWLKPIPNWEIYSGVIWVSTKISRVGKYKVSVRVSNFVELLNSKRMPELSKIIKVTKRQCSHPTAYVDAPSIHFKKDDLRVMAGVLLNCSSSSLMELRWEILYRPNKVSEWQDVTEVYLDSGVIHQRFNSITNMTSPLDKSVLIRGTTMEYGFYKLTMTCWMVEDAEIDRIVSHEMRVVKSDLVIRLSPMGARRDLVFKQLVTVNGYSLTYDPDVGGVDQPKGDIKIYYFCKRSCEGSWPELRSFHDVDDFINDPEGYPQKHGFSWQYCATDDEQLVAQGFLLHGCFVHGYQVRMKDENSSYGFPALRAENFTRVHSCLQGECVVTLAKIDSVNQTLEIDSSYQFDNATYNLLVIATKDNRFSIATQSYRLERGVAPQVQIYPVTNNVYSFKDVAMFNPTSRASLHGLVTNRIPGRRYSFDWKLLKVPDNMSASDLLSNLEESEQFTWREKYWLQMTSTGRHGEDLSIGSNMFGPNEYQKYFVVYLAVAEAGNPRPGISGLAFYVNKPPNATGVNCKINRLTGTAMSTRFHFNCSGFKSDYPLADFAFSVQTCRFCPKVVVTPSLASPTIKTGIILPPGIVDENFNIKLFVDAIDPYGSMAGTSFSIQSSPRISLKDLVRMIGNYSNILPKMMTEDVCHNIFGFAALTNEFRLRQVFKVNMTAYRLMTTEGKNKMYLKVKRDQERFDKELSILRKVRFNSTKLLLAVLDSKGVRVESNSIRSCCGAVNYVAMGGEQVVEGRTGDNIVELIAKLTDVVEKLTRLPTRDADRVDETVSSCIGAAGKAMEAFELALETLRPYEEKRLKINRAIAKETSRYTAQLEAAVARDKATWGGRYRRSAIAEEAESLGTMLALKRRVGKLTAIVDKLQRLALSVKVTQEKSTRLFATGIASNLQTSYTGDLSYAVIASGSSDHCGTFTIGNAGVMFRKTGDTHGKMGIKATTTQGNPFKFNDSSEDLNSLVQSLFFLNSTGYQVPVADLPIEIEIMIESKNKARPGNREIRTLSAPYRKRPKLLILNVTAFSAVFLTVERWNLPDLCQAGASVTPRDLGLGLTCSPGANVTTLLFNHDNYSLQSLNITDEQVIFFVYAKFEDIPEPNNFDVACTLPRMSFEKQYMIATRLPWYGEPTATESSQASVKEGVTPFMKMKPIGTNLAMTPSQSGNGKNCSRPMEPSENSCFFDHRLVNVTSRSRLLKVAVRAVPVSDVQAHLRNWTGSGVKDLSQGAAFRAAMEALEKKSLLVGYRFSSFTTNCKYFDEANKSWLSRGCRVGPLSSPTGNPSMTQCLCNHLTVFSSNLNVPFNMFEPPDPSFVKIDPSPICMTFGLCVFCGFLVIVIWARKKDKADEAKWGATPLIDNDPRDQYAYEITVWTGNKPDSGTSARVSFVLTGDGGQTPVHMLEGDRNDAFRLGAIDSFLLLTPKSLGKLALLRIWHDSSGRNQNWFLSRLMVNDLQRNRQYYFVCNRWLAMDEDDGMVERSIPVASQGQLAGFEHLFTVRSRRKLVDGHIWLSVFSRPFLSHFTRCQRLTCCVASIYCMMIANLIFFAIDRESSDSSKLEVGPLKISVRRFLMSIAFACLVFVVVDLGIVQIFRHSRNKPTRLEKRVDSTPVKSKKGKAKKSARRSKKKRKKSYKLPWGFVVVGYLLAWIPCGVAFWAVVEYGSALGADKALEWLIAMCVCLITDILVLQPLQIVVNVLFYTLIFRSPNRDDDVAAMAALKDDEVLIQPPVAHEPTQRYGDFVLLPPSPEELKLARAIRLKEQMVRAVVSEFVFYVFFTCLVMFVTYAERDNSVFDMQQQMRRMFSSGSLATPTRQKAKIASHDENLFDLMTAEHFFSYLERTLVPSILNGTWYNGKYSKKNGDVYIRDQASILVGSLRIRQLRVRSDACRPAQQVRKIMITHCSPEYSSSSEETGNFSSKWVSKGAKGDPRGFSYSRETADQDPPLRGNLATYGGGGYIVDLGRTYQSALARISYLRENRWIDTRTRAVFFEFNLYCPNSNLWAISQTVIEFFEGGSIVVMPYFHVIRPNLYEGTFALVVLGFQIGTAVLCVGLLANQILLIYKFKGLYCNDSWAITELFHLVLYLVYSALVAARYVVAVKIFGTDFKYIHNIGYTNFNSYILYDELVNLFVALVVFVATIKFIRVIRFSTRPAVVISTLKIARNNVLSIIIAVVVIYVAFAHLGYLTFGIQVERYSTFTSSLMSLLVTTLKRLDFDQVAVRESSLEVSTFFFIFFALFINILLVNCFVALVLVAYHEVRSDETKIDKDHEMFEFMVIKFKRFIGLHPRNPYSLTIDRRFAYVDTTDENDIEIFISRMDELTKRIDAHLERTKTQFPSLFDKQYLRRRQREIYVAE